MFGDDSVEALDGWPNEVNERDGVVRESRRRRREENPDVEATGTEWYYRCDVGVFPEDGIYDDCGAVLEGGATQHNETTD